MSSLRSSLPWLALLLALVAAVTLCNRRLPLVRNSLVYARASENVIAAGYDPRPVVADSALSYDKPILYAWFSAPFVRALGTHDGLRATSFLTTAAYVLALLAFARAHRDLLPPGGETLALVLGAFGPCVFYQFWSAHPDGWFAALVTAAWTLCRRIVAGEARDPRPSVLGLGAVVLTAVLLKNYGLVLLGSVPLYLFWHRRALRADPARLARLVRFGVPVLAGIVLFVALAWSGHNPLSRLEGEGGGVGQYGAGELRISAFGTLLQLGLALALQLTVCVVALLGPRAWTGLGGGLACFALPYVVGLMPFPTTFYNMRYFVPLFPCAAVIAARGLLAAPARARRLLLGAHALLATLLVLVFDVPAAYRRAEPAIPRMEVRWIGVPLSLLDNLRMRAHLDQARVLEHVNAHVPDGGLLYWLDATYYGDAQHGVYERAGLVRPGIRTRYARSRDFQPAEPSFHVHAPRAPDLSGLGAVTDLGEALYLVERPRATR